jgi:hypothetical protein
LGKEKSNKFDVLLAVQEKLRTLCHSGLDPESSVFNLDSRLRGNDEMERTFFI